MSSHSLSFDQVVTFDAGSVSLAFPLEKVSCLKVLADERILLMFEGGHEVILNQEQGLSIVSKFLDYMIERDVPFFCS